MSSLEEAIALFERCGQGYLVACSRVMLGATLLARGEAERAERAFEEGLVSARRLKIPSLGYITLYNSAQSALARGDLEKAARMLGEGIELSGQTKDRANLAHFLSALAAVDAFRGWAERSALLLGAAEGLLQDRRRYRRADHGGVESGQHPCQPWGGGHPQAHRGEAA